MGVPGLWWIGLLELSMVCASMSGQEPAHSWDEPEATFAGLEQRLLSASVVRFDFHVTATGAFEADLRGTLNIDSTEHVQLAASGLFNGQQVDLLLRSEAGILELGGTKRRTAVPNPPALKEALLIGLTRMGILHNLARLTGAMEPDRADGSVRDWVGVVHFAANAPGLLSFDLIVDGNPAGSALLEIGPHNNPVSRTQTVRFASGDMRVVERYSEVVIDP